MQRPSSLDIEDARLLDDGLDVPKRPNQEEKATKGAPWLRPLFTHALVAILTLILYSTFTSYSKISPPHRPLSEALTNLRWEVVPTKSIMVPDSIYYGGPESPADEAWARLLGNISMKASSDELSRNGDHQHSTAVSPNDEYLVWVNVFHQLHCLKKLRRMTYRDYYHANDTEAQRAERTIHADHCVETLRQMVMCNPDMALTTFDWESSKPKPALNVMSHERNCINWEALMSSMKPRVLSHEQMTSVVNPILDEEHSTKPHLEDE